jgi:hypothetical protein
MLDNRVKPVIIYTTTTTKEDEENGKDKKHSDY